MSTTASKLVCLALAGSLLQSDAFSQTGRSGCFASLRNVLPNDTARLAPTTATTLCMSEEAAEVPPEEGETAEEEVVEEPPEDPEVTALKESIAELEATLADKKSKLQYELEKCEEYSKSGYARKVADMENMKRVRSNIASTSQSSATAAVLKEFLPVYDTLNTLKESYSENEFGKKYSELNLQSTFATLGVTDFEVAPGDKVNNFRMKVLESEVNAEFAKDTILSQVASGMELDGNVIRPAMVVSSLGPEEEQAAEEEAAEEPAE